jgi:hypothetical protein
VADPLDTEFSQRHWKARKDVLHLELSQLPTSVPDVLKLIEDAYLSVPEVFRDRVRVSWNDQFAMIPGLHVYYYLVEEVAQ